MSIVLQNKIQSIAIGSFDGIHLAHKELSNKVDAMVIIERNGGYITPGYKRSLYTDKVCCFYHFDKIKSLTPQEFVDRLKEDFPSLNTIVVGYDFFFGKGKSGDVKVLSEICDREVVIVNEIKHNDISVHSRVIKQYIKDGNIEMVTELLGRNFIIDGTIIKGQGIGKKELLPTINLNVQDFELPKEGVYATRTNINSNWYDSVSFIGHRVSTDGSFAVETHILDEDIDDVGIVGQIEFIQYIRENKKFESLVDLKTAIMNDIEISKKVLVDAR